MRPLEDRVHGPLFPHDAVAHHDDAVGDLPDKREIVTDEQHAHAHDTSESTRRRRLRSSRNRLFCRLPRLTEMNVKIDQPRRDDLAAAIDGLRLRVEA